MIKQDTHPSLLIPLPSLSRPQRQINLTNGTGFHSQIAHLPKYTLVAAQTFCIHIEFNYSWDDDNIKEKLKAKVMQNFRGQTTCVTRFVQMGNDDFEKWSLYLCVTFT